MTEYQNLFFNAVKDILNSSFEGSGYNENYGLYGSNRATEDTVKLFPRDCVTFVNALQKSLKMKKLPYKTSIKFRNFSPKLGKRKD